MHRYSLLNAPHQGLSYINNYITVTPTLAAFAACLQRQVVALQGRMLRLLASQTPTLLELHIRLERELQQMAVLYSVLEATLPNGRAVLRCHCCSCTVMFRMYISCSCCSSCIHAYQHMVVVVYQVAAKAHMQLMGTPYYVVIAYHAGRVSAADGTAHLLTTLHNVLRNMACGTGPYGTPRAAAWQLHTPPPRGTQGKSTALWCCSSLCAACGRCSTR